MAFLRGIGEGQSQVDSKAWVLDNIDVVLLLVIGLLALTIILFLISTIRLGRLQKRYRMLMKGVQQGNLEETLFQYASHVQQMEETMNQVLANQERLQNEIHVSPGPVSVVRYNAFKDTGSDLSYSIAILNRNGDGVVFTSIFGREESRNYAKPVTAGVSTYPLSDEERAAIEKALRDMQ